MKKKEKKGGDEGRERNKKRTELIKMSEKQNK